MAKKGRKRSSTRRGAGLSTSRTSQAAAATTRSAQSQPQVTEADFAVEYHYVLGDLKRIGVLAAAMFVLLVILALVLG